MLYDKKLQQEKNLNDLTFSFKMLSRFFPKSRKYLHTWSYGGYTLLSKQHIINHDNPYVIYKWIVVRNYGH